MTTSSEHPADIPFPTEGRLLGIDYGHVRIGVAVSTPEQNIASPLKNYTRGSDAADADFLRQMADEYRAVGIVIGLPVHMSGEESESSRLAREFGAWVGRVTELPITFWDERFTSAMAEAHLLSANLSKKKRGARRDKLAATFLLQSFLDTDDRDRRPASVRDTGR